MPRTIIVMTWGRWMHRARQGGGLIILVALALSAAASAATAPTAKLSNVKLSAIWKEGWLTASLHFDVTSSGAGDLQATVRPVQPGPVASVQHFTFTQAGTSSETIKLPARLPPRAYTLKVGDATSSFTIPTPPEGVVDSAIISTSKNGKSLHTLPSTKEMWVHFHFMTAPPTAKTVEVEWRTPQFKFVGEVKRSYNANIYSQIASSAPLPAGTWYALLLVNGKVAKRQDFRISS
jgi:hypothetical protein